MKLIRKAASTRRLPAAFGLCLSLALVSGWRAASAGTLMSPNDALLPAGTQPPVPAASATPTPLNGIPASVRIDGVTGHRQALPLSCEARSAADWAAYFGTEIDELEFLAGIPASDDPDKGFVGDPEGDWGRLPPHSYGVHAWAVARRLREYGLAARSQRYFTWEKVQAEIHAGRPVIAWVVGHVEAGEPLLYTARDGRRTIVARYEHTVIVVGYTEDSVTVVDGARTYRRSLEQFLASWGALRNMAVTMVPDG